MTTKVSTGLIGTGEAARLLGIHPDTLRKRVKAGKIEALRDLKGKLWFDPAKIGSPTPPNAPAPSVGVQETDVIFVIDRSGSMAGMELNMQKAVQDQLDAFRASLTASVRFRVGNILFSTCVGPFTGFVPVESAVAPDCRSDSGYTALYDAIVKGLDIIDRSVLVDPKRAALLIVVTDGQENQSTKNTLLDVKNIMGRLSSTDRLTAVACCPPRHEGTMVALGFAPGNVRAWEASARGIADLGRVQVNSTVQYATTRGTGQTYTTSYFADLSGDPTKVAQKLSADLNDVTGQVSVERVASGDPNVIRKFAEKKFGSFDKGSIFYELVKSEKVQDYKRIIVQDKTTGKFFHGWDAARSLLKLPATKGEIRVRPGNLGEFKVFVQSTSYTRKLDPGTAVVRLP